MNSSPRSFALFDYGFRPFFLLAGLYAFIAVLAWLTALLTGAWPDAALPSPLWHGHEMLYGFVGSAIAGFLLTAVPSWTGERGFSGRPLILLAILWLAGRLAMPFGFLLPPLLTAIIDLAFFPALGLTIAPSLVHGGKSRNLVFPVFLGVLFIANLIFHVALVRNDATLAGYSLLLAVNTVLLIIAIIGGRIVPAFTLSAIRRTDQTFAIMPFPALDRAAVASILLILVVDLGWRDSRVAGVLAILAALIHAIRLARWQTLRGIGIPIVWILHVAYAWVIIGLALKGIFLLGHAAFASTWLHALTLGAFTGMIIAVMTRASLGHTGRPLIAPAPIVAAYVLITLAALARVLGPVLPVTYLHTVVLSGVFWLSAFLLFLYVYTPILVRPRADGKPG